MIAITSAAIASTSATISSVEVPPPLLNDDRASTLGAGVSEASDGWFHSTTPGVLTVGVLVPVSGTWRLFIQAQVDGHVLTAPFTLHVT